MKSPVPSSTAWVLPAPSRSRELTGSSTSPRSRSDSRLDRPQVASICLAASAALAALKSRLITFRSRSLSPWLARALANDSWLAVPRNTATRLPLRSCRVLMPEPGTTPR
ncbi:hypothetical protein D3C75_960110 [compost metagenome]